MVSSRSGSPVGFVFLQLVLVSGVCFVFFKIDSRSSRVVTEGYSCMMSETRQLSQENPTGKECENTHTFKLQSIKLNFLPLFVLLITCLLLLAKK